MTLSLTHLSNLSADVSALAAAAAPSTVAIAHKRTVISGFYIRADVIATASEPLEARCGEALMVQSATAAPASGTIIGHDPATDVVLIRASVPGLPLPAAIAPEVALGQAVLAAGRTQHGATAALGFVSLAAGPWRSMRGGEMGQRVMLDARLGRAAEGAAVVDTAGGLLGMAVFGPRRRVLLIPAGTIEKSAVELLAHGRIRQGYLGVSVQALPMPGTGPEGAKNRAMGLMVMGLDANGPAAASGMLRGDIIVAIDGKEPKSPRGLARLLPGSMIGAATKVDLVRAGQPTHLTVTIGEHPDQ